MALEKRTVYSSIEFSGADPVGIRLSKQIYDTTTQEVVQMEPHRTTISPGVSAAEQMAAVNAHLAAMGYPPAPDEVLLTIEAHRQIEIDLFGDTAALLAAVTASGAAERLQLAADLAAKTAEVTTLEETVASQAAELEALRPQVIDGVPQEVAMNKARKALALAGLLDQVEAAIAAAPAPEGDLVRIDWQYATGMKRQAPFVLMMADVLGLSSVQVDELFVLASTLP